MSVLRRCLIRSPAAVVALLTTLSLVILVLIYSANIINLSPEQMLEDYDYLVEFINDNYVLFDVFKNETGIDWLEHAAEERKAILPKTTPRQFYRLIHELVAILDNHHTMILPVDIWERHQKNIATSPDNINCIRYQPFYDDTIKKKYAQWKRVAGVGPTRWASSAPPGVSTKVIEEDRIAYVGIPSFSADRVASERDTLKSFFEEIIDYPYLIIDITENGGGSDRYWRDNIVRPLITAETTSHRYILFRDSAFTRGWSDLDVSNLNPITDLPSELNSGEYDFARHFGFFYNNPTILQPDDSVGFEGQIIIMTSGWTASSANSFAMFAKHSGWATLAGGPTHGAGAVDAYTSLPNSGLVLKIDTTLVLNNDGSLNKVVGTQPDVVIDGEDKLERVIEYINRAPQQRQEADDFGSLSYIAGPAFTPSYSLPILARA